MLVQMDARSIISSAFRQLRKFLIVFIPVNLLAVLYIMTATPAFESTASVMVKFGQDARPEVAIEGLSSTGLSAEEKRGMVQSNLNILNSRDLAKALLTDITVEKAYPELAANATEPSKTMEAAIKRFGADLATSTQADAGIINISLFNPDPAVAATLLRHLLDLFTLRQSEIFGNPQTEVLSEQATEAAKRLDEANHKLSDFKNQNGIASLDEELSLLLKQRGDITGYLSRRPEPAAADASTDPAATTSVAPTSGMGALPARISGSGDTARFPVLEDIQRRIDVMRAKESELLVTYRANSPVVINLRRNIAAEEKALNESLGALNGQIADLDRQINEKQQFRGQYDDLTRAVSLSEAAYKTAQDRLQSAEVNSDLNQRKITRISVIQQPTDPYKPSRPQKTLTLALSIIVGGALAVAICLLSELLDQTFSRTEQLKAVFDKPVLASFSRKARKNASLMRQDLAALYHSISASLPDQAHPVVYLGSCYKGEGTSTIAYELAQYVTSTLQRRVLLIEQSASGLATKPTASLLDVAEGRAPLASALVEAGSVKLACLATDNQEELALANLAKLQQLLAQVRTQFDLILVPAAGMIQSSSTLGFAKLADGVLMIVEAERTRAPVVQQILQTVSEGGSRVLGTVLNKRKLYIPRWLYSRL